jgi:transcriptional regulator with XRE-family HTH domain
MLLHEAVRKARQDLGVSQVKLAERAGIQRRQLSTLEKGGNVTLSTLRKVIAQLPNLESFTLDAVNVHVTSIPMRLDEQKWHEAMQTLGEVFTSLAGSIAANGLPSPGALQAMRDVSTKLFASVVPDTEKTAVEDGDTAARDAAPLVESLESLANDLSAGLAVKSARVAESALEVYYKAEELAQDPEHADLIPHIQRMREAYEKDYGRPIPPRKKG